MRECREALEATVLTWPGVAPKDMMGCKVYFRGRKFFAFLVTGGIVIGGKLSEGDRATLARRSGAKPFQMARKASSHWVQLPLGSPEDLRPILPYVRKSYDASGP